MFTATADTLYTHLFIGSEARSELDGTKLTVKLNSELPWKGEAGLTVSSLEGSGDVTLAIRVPGWSQSTSFALNGEPVEPEIRDGYAYLKRCWQEGDRFTVSLDMTPRRIYASPKVRADVGRVALQRGPLVYCFEEADNGPLLAGLSLRADSGLREIAGDWRPEAVFLQAEGFRLEEREDSLYTSAPPAKHPVTVTAVPYTLWGNRSPGEEMLVWIREEG